MKKYQQFKKELLQDKEIKKAYQELEPEFFLIEKIIKKRIEKGLTQKELAKKLGTKQSAISRFESGTYNPSFMFLKKIANAMNVDLRVSLVEYK